MVRVEGTWQGRRFAVVVLGGVLVSLTLLAVLVATTTTTPEQARAQRAIPDLPPPTMVVAEGSRIGVVAIPQGAIVTDEDGRAWVSVWQGNTVREVEVHPEPPGSAKLIEVRGSGGLEVGDLVVLVPMDHTVGRPSAHPQLGGVPLEI